MSRRNSNRIYKKVAEMYFIKLAVHIVDLKYFAIQNTAYFSIRRGAFRVTLFHRNFLQH